MCSSKTRSRPSSLDMDQNVSKINGRPVLQPTCNRVPSLLERRNSIKKSPQKTPIIALPAPKTAKPKLSPSPPISPKPKSPKKVATNGSSSGTVDKKPVKTGSPKANTESSATLRRSSSSKLVESPGSLAAARREQVANMQAMRKMKIAHYGRTNSSKYAGKVVPIDSPTGSVNNPVAEKKRCDFLSPNSDPIYVAYHDEEWGVPVHDDKLLFEMLVLTAVQVGSDWTSVLRRRQKFREAFSDFEPEIVARLCEREVAFICNEYGIELGQVRGAIDNAGQILKIKELFGSFSDYLWKFVNYKPMSTQYRSSHKIPVKTSKSEAISKDMIKRGFRFVGPAVIHSFMQATGLTNDHIVSCPRHSS